MLAKILAAHLTSVINGKILLVEESCCLSEFRGHVFETYVCDLSIVSLCVVFYCWLDYNVDLTTTDWIIRLLNVVMILKGGAYRGDCISMHE